MRPSRDTSSGLAFERYASIEATIKELGYIINTRPHSKFKAIQRGKHFLGYLLPKHKLYDFVPHYRAFISRKLLPDNMVVFPEQKKAYVFEMKTQSTAGSADEKLQTCDFKIKQYQKLLPNYEVHYIYILNDWFKKPIYKDVRDYIKSIDNCDFLWYNEIKDFLGGIL